VCCGAQRKYERVGGRTFATVARARVSSPCEQCARRTPRAIPCDAPLYTQAGTALTPTALHQALRKRAAAPREAGLLSERQQPPLHRRGGRPQCHLCAHCMHGAKRSVHQRQVRQPAKSSGGWTHGDVDKEYRRRTCSETPQISSDCSSGRQPSPFPHHTHDAHLHISHHARMHSSAVEQATGHHSRMSSPVNRSTRTTRHTGEPSKVARRKQLPSDVRSTAWRVRVTCPAADEVGCGNPSLSR
jgi:hypothetical protein